MSRGGQLFVIFEVTVDFETLLSPLDNYQVVHSGTMPGET